MQCILLNVSLCGLESFYNYVLSRWWPFNIYNNNIVDTSDRPLLLFNMFVNFIIKFKHALKFPDGNEIILIIYNKAIHFCYVFNSAFISCKFLKRLSTSSAR